MENKQERGEKDFAGLICLRIIMAQVPSQYAFPAVWNLSMQNTVKEVRLALHQVKTQVCTWVPSFNTVPWHIFYLPSTHTHTKLIQTGQTYPSMISLSYGHGRSQTGHIHVGFRSFIIRYVAASKHCKCVHMLARQGIWIRILPSCKTLQNNRNWQKVLLCL